MKIPVIFSVLFALSLNLFSQEPDSIQPRSFSFEASYVGDIYNNLSGGIKNGSAYLGMANLRLGLNTDKLWKGGQFYINAANTHGNTPSSQLSGDFQVASNIEAGNHTYIQELWYKQVLGPVEVTAGLQDLNAEFVASENGSYFLNSSFGIMPTISGNIPTPIFPLTSVGLTLKWNISDKTTWLVSAYDGCPTAFEDNNPYNLNWNLKSGDGILMFSELQRSTSFASLPGTYKIGFFSHYNHTSTLEEGQQQNLVKNNYGFYMISDQTLWQQSDSKKLAMFWQLGYTPGDFNINRLYTGAGLNYFGLLNKNGEDVLSLGVAHVRLNEQTFNETAIELTYQLPVTQNIFVQPDLHYIINPAGTGEKIDNSFSAILRFGLSF